ncbi:hypothetical protein CPB85DRAFT_1212836 [Mucidula mucida]|nr:hypothetical protein CPB85DRAFT_1233643 [Mucidula mucida]KAF8919366.1 hypothetical protein CPB85DRAFT_1212836 [Mucidula mucida]
MSTLPEHLRAAARLFTSIVNNNGGQAILMGGAASKALGARRETKDLDFNLSVMNDDIVKGLQSQGITTKKEQRPNRFSANVPETAPGNHDATSVDLAVKPGIVSILPYTKSVGDITVADPRLLLVDKIRCFTERSDNQDKKLRTDIEDIEFCIDEILKENEYPLPAVLVHLLNDDVWLKYWARLAERASMESVEDQKEYFQELGLIK